MITDTLVGPPLRQLMTTEALAPGRLAVDGMVGAGLTVFAVQGFVALDDFSLRN